MNEERDRQRLMASRDMAETAFGSRTAWACAVCARDDARWLRRLRGCPGRAALDMGTGSGYVGIYLALHGWEVHATDVSLRAVELAQRNAAANGAPVACTSRTCSTGWRARSTSSCSIRRCGLTRPSLAGS